MINRLGRAPLLFAERIDGGEMTVEDCASISRALSAIFDVEDPIRGAYTLEVSSPGIDRPLTRAKDFDRFAGHLAKVEMQSVVKGRKRYNGTILGVIDDNVRLATENGDVELPVDEIVTAKLVITDELIAASQSDTVH